MRQATANPNVPEDAFLNQAVNGVVEAPVIYTEKVTVLPFDGQVINFAYVAGRCFC